MYKLIETIDNYGSKIRATIKTSQEELFQEQNLSNILILQIPHENLNENDSWNEIEDYFEVELTKLYKVDFFCRTVRKKSAELFYYCESSLNREFLENMSMKWSPTHFLFNDKDYYIYQEMSNNNFLNQQAFEIFSQFPILFKTWEENGININESFNIMFSFYSADKEQTDKFEIYLKNNGYDVKRKTKRSLIIFKGHITHSEKNQKWDQNKLLSEYSKLVLEANKYSNIHEGIFASE